MKKLITLIILAMTVPASAMQRPNQPGQRLNAPQSRTTIRTADEKAARREKAERKRKVNATTNGVTRAVTTCTIQ